MSISFKSIACLVGLVMCLNAPVWAQQPMTSPDGGIASVGAKADSADTNPLSVNTLMAFTKGLVKIFSDVWDSVNHRLKVDGSGVVQPVSATALPLPNGAASESTLSARLSDSTFTGRFPAAFTSADTIAAQTASFVHGGMMGWNSAASKWDRLQLDASDNLKVSIQNGSIAVTGTFWQATQPVSGTITANAGTNLNTSALALESGGNLAAVASVGGSTADVAVTADATGTLSSKLRGLVKMISDVWDGTNHWLKVSIQNATMAVTQSGTWTVQPGNTPNTVAWKVDGSAVTQPVSGTFWQATRQRHILAGDSAGQLGLRSFPSGDECRNLCRSAVFQQCNRCGSSCCRQFYCRPGFWGHRGIADGYHGRGFLRACQRVYSHDHALSYRCVWPSYPHHFSRYQHGGCEQRGPDLRNGRDLRHGHHGHERGHHGRNWMELRREWRHHARKRNRHSVPDHGRWRQRVCGHQRDHATVWKSQLCDLLA